MATILLSAAGAAIGGSVGGTVLGLSAVAAGRFVGATLGRAIDQRLMGQGADVVETGRMDRLRLTGSGEGEAIAQVHGRIRAGGQVIWASRFQETVTVSGGGKGAPSQPRTRSYGYTVSLAVALCEGVIAGVGRIWADGSEIAPNTLAMRVYTGTPDQMPDPRIEAVEGAGRVPAYRGTAYVVIEDLDLSAYGNRVPQFTFEVIRPDQAGLLADPDPVHLVQGVALMPGTGEYALSTRPAVFTSGPGVSRVANVNTASGRTDLETSLDQLAVDLPRADAVSLIVSWFGDDLRAGSCTMRPMVEQASQDAQGHPWTVAGLTRTTAQVLPQVDGRVIYGGTPSDASVLEAIAALKSSGKQVMFYPFLLMTQLPGNARPDPYSDASDQPLLPWRGRITGAVAPGRDSTTDGTAQAATEVAAFFGTAQASDFIVAPGSVTYIGPAEWSYRRFILHQAALCAAAGGVESFCIGSEMVALTRLRDAASYPAVTALVALAADVRALLGAAVKIGYAADWSEYWGHAPGNGDRLFQLDPLWGDVNIDFVGIDNYMPLSDWRDDPGHTDEVWGAIHDLGYLRANIEGGEGYDWFYPTSDAVAAQRRDPITDGAYDEPWVWRYKDIRSWWKNPHHDRIGGVRQVVPTSWVPGSKPVRFTEIGCPAVDKGTNEPNKFLDPKSSESALPRASTGARDDLIQVQYLRALLGYWADPARNPVSEIYDGPMIDLAHTYVWAWDARPWPAFPRLRDVWSDGANYARGHWITGRMGARTLASVVTEICARAGVTAINVTTLHGLVRGYAITDVTDGRAALQPLMLRHGFDAVEREGVIAFLPRTGRAVAVVGDDGLVATAEVPGDLRADRAAEADMAGRVRLRFIAAEADYEIAAAESVLPDTATQAVATSDLPLVMTRNEAQHVVERWLVESRIARDGVKLALPPSRADLRAGDVIDLRSGAAAGLYRIDRLELGPFRIADAVRVEPGAYLTVDLSDDLPPASDFTPPIPPLPLFLDLPLIRGDEVDHAPHLALAASPWPGAMALYSAPGGEDFTLMGLFGRPAAVGTLVTALPAASAAVIDRGAPVQVRMARGTLQSIGMDRLLAGANLAVIGDGRPDAWEVIQFGEAQLIAPDEYLITQRIRGRNGSDSEIAPLWPVGSYFVLLDEAPEQIALAASDRGVSRTYRVGPARRALDDPSYVEVTAAFAGMGLRPLSPVHLRAQDQAGDLVFTWTRRSRIDGDSWDGYEVPLGEETELYRLRILDAARLVREVILTAPGWTYPSALRVPDGSAGYLIEITQISARFGPGAPARMTLP
jgi:hypothetical protein